jgi:hypothetical protein
VSFPKVLTALLLATGLAACSSHKGSATAGVATGSPAPAVNQSTPVSGTAAGNGGTMAGEVPGGARAPAPVPSDLNCGGAAPVWVNQRSRVYHEPGDPLYGRTKHGSYMCPSMAIAAGNHLAARHGRYRKRGMMTNAGGAPNPAGT